MKLSSFGTFLLILCIANGCSQQAQHSESYAQNYTRPTGIMVQGSVFSLNTPELIESVTKESKFRSLSAGEQLKYLGPTGSSHKFSLLGNPSYPREKLKGTNEITLTQKVALQLRNFPVPVNNVCGKDPKRPCLVPKQWPVEVAFAVTGQFLVSICDWAWNNSKCSKLVDTHLSRLPTTNIGYIRGASEGKYTLWVDWIPYNVDLSGGRKFGCAMEGFEVKPNHSVKIRISATTYEKCNLEVTYEKL